MEYTNINNNNPEVLLYKTGNLSGCLAHLKCKKGRRRILTDLDDVLPISDLFASDTSKLYSSKAWRRMGDKTQVFTSPNTALVRTRATHVAEVIACSIIASEALGLNTSLVIAAAVGHDIGHVPLGHQGEKWIANQMGHASTEMLFKVYSRYVPNLTRNDGSAFEKLLAESLELNHEEQLTELV